MVITEEEITLIEKLDASPKTLEWLREKPRTWEDFIESHSTWILKHAAAHLLTLAGRLRVARSVGSTEVCRGASHSGADRGSSGDDLGG